jgi:hypothetical protein
VGGLRLWHGGAPGLRAGDALLPPSQTGAYSRATISLEEGLTDIAQRPDLVYATTDRDFARAWAGLHTTDGQTFGGGALYRVELVNPEPDEDLLSLPGVSFQAQSGVVLAVYNAHVPNSPRHLQRLRKMLEAHEAGKDVAPW